MKLHLGWVIASLFSIPGAQAASTFAEMSTSGGFTIGAPPPVTGIRVHGDGSVVTFEGNKVTPVAHLAKPQAKKVKALISEIQSGSMKIENPEGPECADVPTVLFKVIQQNGKEIEIAKRESCRNWSLPQGKASILKELLEGLSKLNYLK